MMLVKIDFPVSLAYVPMEQMKLAWFLMQFCMDEETQASPPDFFMGDVLRQTYGHCPAQSGQDIYYKIVGEEIWIYDPEYLPEIYDDEGYVLTGEPNQKIIILPEENVNLRYDGIRAYLRGDL